MPHYFDSAGRRITLRERIETPNRGFRPGQLGALHAVQAHLSVYEEPCTVCLPTGYGKTAVMMALPFVLRSGRMLIIEPSNVLRNQVSGHFKELATLKRIGAIPSEETNPEVHRLESRPSGWDEWSALERFDVVVSTPSSSSPQMAPGCPPSLFDLIIFDEAHHAPADTWAAYLDYFQATATFVFLTATPFRRDRKIIPGRLVYRYPILRAVHEGAFSPVAFRAAETDTPHDDQRVDSAIADAAIAQLREDQEKGYDHRLLARASTIESAKSLVTLYRAKGVNVEAVTSHISKRMQEDIEARLQSGALIGVVCVDMFGEGYDLPKLKVAALHAPHQSLVPTIQFIGRFARVDASTGVGTLIAPRSRMQESTADLLAEGVELVQILDAAALEEIQIGVEAQELLERLPVRIQRESDYEAVSPLTLELYAHVVVFQCARAPEFSEIGESVGRNLRIVKQWTSADNSMTLLLTADKNPPDWATSDVLVNIRHDAFLLVHKPGSRLLYLGSTRRTQRIYLNLMDVVCKDGYRPLSYEETSKARAGLENLKFFAIGLRNTTLNSRAESYRTMTGPQAERQLNAGDARAYVQGHFFGAGEAGDERETIGASGSSRIWSNQRLDITEFLKWVSRLDSRLMGGLALSATHLDLVRSATTLTRLPEIVIAAIWPKNAFRQNPRIRTRQREGEPWTYALLTDLEIGHFDCNSRLGRLRFCIARDDLAVRLTFVLGGGRMIVPEENATQIEIEDRVDHWTPIAEWLCSNPPVFFGADKSSFEGVNLMSPPPMRVASLADGDAEAVPWDGCDITKEFYSLSERKVGLPAGLSVQDRLARHLELLPEPPFCSSTIARARPPTLLRCLVGRIVQST